MAPPMSRWDLGLWIGSLAFAGMVKGVTGMGLPLFATPVLAGVFGARPAVVIISIPVFVTNLLLVYEGRRVLAAVLEMWLIALAGAFGVVLGLLLLVRLDQNLLALLIAGLVFTFLARGERLVGADPQGTRLRWLGPLIGCASGVLNGSTSIASPLLGGYLHARRVPAREFVASAAAVFQVFSIVQVVGLWRLGLYDRALLTTGLVSLAPALLALVVGMRVRARLNTAMFRRVITLLLGLSGINLLVQGLRGLGALP